MPDIDTSKVFAIAQDMAKINTSLTNDFSVVEKAVKKLRSDIQSPSEISEGIVSSFDELKENYFNAANKKRRELIDYLCNVVGKGYEDAEKTNKDLLEDAFKNPDVNNGNTSSNTKPQVGTSVSNTGATRYQLPDYALQGLYPDENGVWGNMVFHRDGSMGAVSYYNDPSTRTQLSCTYYTLRKLNQRGLSYPCTGGPGNGADWYRNFDRESGLPHYSGTDALTKLVENLTLPQENIVVSYASNTSSDAYLRTCGHVMLIDRIYRDENGVIYIESSDNWPNISNVNGSNPAKKRTFDEFMSHYSKYNGNINGVAVIGAAHN